MPQLLNTRILVGKIESSPGTVATLTDADYDVRIRDPQITPIIEMDDENQKFATGDHGEDNSIPGAQSATIEFHTKSAWSGTAATEPKWWKFMKGCGAKEKTYTPSTTTGCALQPLKENDNKTLTIEVFDIAQGGASPAAIKYQFAGCMGNCVLSCEGIGMPILANYTFTGKLVDITDVAYGSILALTSPDTTVAEKMLGSALTIGGVTQQISSFSLDLGNEINPLIDQSESTGYEYFGITARRPRFSCNPIQQTVATEDVLANWIAGTNKTAALTIPSSSTHLTLHIPVMQLMNAGIASREGYINWDQTWKCLRNAGTDSDIADEGTWELLHGSRT